MDTSPLSVYIMHPFWNAVVKVCSFIDMCFYKFVQTVLILSASNPKNNVLMDQFDAILCKPTCTCTCVYSIVYKVSYYV